MFSNTHFSILFLRIPMFVIKCDFVQEGKILKIKYVEITRLYS